MRKYYGAQVRAAFLATIHHREARFFLLVVPASFAATIIFRHKADLMAVWIALVTLGFVCAGLFLFNLSRSSYLVYEAQETQIRVLQEGQNGLQEQLRQQEDARQQEARRQDEVWQAREAARFWRTNLARLIPTFRQMVSAGADPAEMTLQLRQQVDELAARYVELEQPGAADQLRDLLADYEPQDADDVIAKTQEIQRTIASQLYSGMLDWRVRL